MRFVCYSSAKETGHRQFFLKTMTCGAGSLSKTVFLIFRILGSIVKGGNKGDFLAGNAILSNSKGV